MEDMFGRSGPEGALQDLRNQMATFGQPPVDQQPADIAGPALLPNTQTRRPRSPWRWTPCSSSAAQRNIPGARTSGSPSAGKLATPRTWMLGVYRCGTNCCILHPI
eukprot:3104500-Lingulodinium_polyedra.AAC.1